MTDGIRGLSCREVRELLWPLDRPRPYAEREDEARTHLEVCEDCREFFQRDAAVARTLRTRGLAAKAPASLREKVYDALARERALRAFPIEPNQGAGPARVGRRWTGILVASLAVLVAGSVGLAWLTRAVGPAEDLFVQDYISRAAEESYIESSQPAAVTHFFMRELGLPIKPATVAGGSLDRAMICFIRGKRAAMIEYEVNGKVVAHYLVPIDAGIRYPAEMRTASERGLHVVRWKDDQFEHALVSELAAPELADLARTSFASAGVANDS
ncbi:MAG: hypothetical protein ACE5HQ_09635 [Gemmatimonadota bacterium]